MKENQNHGSKPYDLNWCRLFFYFYYVSISAQFYWSVESYTVLILNDRVENQY